MRNERIIGVLRGLAAGDQIGGPVRMALRLAQSLADCGGFSREELAARYLEWWRNDAFDMGPTAARVFLRVERGASWEQAAGQVDREAGGLTAGCNPAHRAAPLAMCAAVPTKALAECARQEAALTHRHPLAGDVAVALVNLCRSLIEGESWECACQSAAMGRLPETEQALRPAVSRTTLSQGGYAPEVLRAAVTFVSLADSPRAALKQAIDFAGPANYCPVLVGSLAGARWGASSIPDDLLSGHAALLPELDTVAQRLARAWD